MTSGKIKIGRNAPCPCGSGKKYKLCCLGNATPVADPDAPDGVVMKPPLDKRIPLAIGTAIVAAAIALALLWDPDKGMAIGLAALLGLGIWVVSRQPPTSRGRGDGGAAIGFGHNQQQKKQAPPSRSRRRRK
jgi:hypothetical protein